MTTSTVGRPHLLMLCIAFFGLGSCSDEPTSSPPIDPAPALVQAPVVEESAVSGWDRELLHLARRIPGFGGLYFDTLTKSDVVYLQDVSHSATARTTLTSYFTYRDQLTPSRAGGRAMSFRPAKYSVMELVEWRVKARSLLSNRKVAMVDLDDEANRVRVSVQDGATRRFVEQSLPQLKIPRSAVIIDRADGWFQSAQLTDRVRPTIGGLQTLWRRGSTTFFCSLGFNVHRNGVRGFLINSHCSDVQGALDGETYYQKSVTSGDLIGTEAFDPPFWTGTKNGIPCPSGRVCRNSDALWANYNAATTSVSRVAETTVIGTGTNPGSKTIGIQRPVSKKGLFSIYPQCCELTKTGASTGTTRGFLYRVCYDGNLAGSTKTLMCQSSALAGSSGGDSGSPVYLAPRFPSDGDSARIVGLLWAGNCSSGVCSEFGFSDGSDILQEFSGLTFQ